jgi:hypothetical protein
MTYQVKGTLVCDLCGTTVREETFSYTCAPIQQPDGIVNFQLESIKATLCTACLTEMGNAWIALTKKLRKEDRLVGFQSYEKWSAVKPQDVQTMLATGKNGDEVATTKDGGLTWTYVPYEEHRARVLGDTPLAATE